MNHKELLVLLGGLVVVLVLNILTAGNNITELKEAAKVSLKCSTSQTVEIERTFSPYTGKEVEARLVCKGGK